MRLRIAAVLLAFAAAASAEEPDLRRALRAEGTVGAGWADRATLVGGGRLVLRVAPLALSLDARGGAQARPSAGGGAAAGKGAPDLASVWTLGAGLTRDVGAWEANASALLGLHVYRYPDVLGLGPAEQAAPLIGVRFGAGRYAPVRVLGWTAYVGTSVTVTKSAPVRSRIRELETSGLAALVALDVGFGRRLR